MAIVIDSANGIQLPAGSVSNPTLKSADADTGIYFPSSNVISIAVDGNDLITISDSTANVIGTLQQNGSNVLVTTNIGTTVQAYDANTAKLDVEQSFTAEQAFTAGVLFDNRTKEAITVVDTETSANVDFDVITQSILYHTGNSISDWTFNVQGDANTALNSIMSTGQSLSIAFLATQNTSPYYQTLFQIDSSEVTPKWQGALPPASGNPSGVDVYSYTIIKTANATFTVLGSQTQFG